MESAIYLWELASVVELDGAVGDGIILEPHEVEVKHWRELLEHDSLLCVLQTKGPRVVLVVPVQCLSLYVVCEAFLDGLLSFDVQLDVVEGLCPRGLVVNVLATDVRDLVGNDENIGSIPKDSTILPSKRRGMVPSTQVAFILDSSLSSSTLRITIHVVIQIFTLRRRLF